MISHGKNRDDGVPSDPDKIKKIGRLVLLCEGVLIVSAGLLVGTALQVMQAMYQDDLAAERLRASGAIDTLVSAFGPLTDDSAVMMGQVAGLRGAKLTREVSSDTNVQQLPLLSGQGPAGSYLTWTPNTSAAAIFQKFAPIRLPIIGTMLIVVLAALLRMRRLVADIDTERRIAHRQSRSDALTGLANRLALDAALDQLSAAGTPFAVLVLDLDRFKYINDAWGHAAGDEVLRTVGARLSRLLGPTDLMARIGGDEFVMVSAGRTDVAALTQLAQDSIAAVEQPIQLAERSVQVGVSIGVVAAGSWYQPPASLIALADAALYGAKAKHGSAFQFSGPERSAPALPRPLKLSA